MLTGIPRGDRIGWRAAGTPAASKTRKRACGLQGRRERSTERNRGTKSSGGHEREGCTRPGARSGRRVSGRGVCTRTHRPAHADRALDAPAARSPRGEGARAPGSDARSVANLPAARASACEPRGRTDKTSRAARSAEDGQSFRDWPGSPHWTGAQVAWGLGGGRFCCMRASSAREYSQTRAPPAARRAEQGTVALIERCADRGRRAAAWKLRAPVFLSAQIDSE